MKVYISTIGIKASVEYPVRDVKNNLNRAKNHNLSCPDNLSGANYIRSLSSKIDGYIKEMNYIYNSLDKSEKKYSTLFEESVENLNKVIEYNIPERIGIKNK